VDKPKKTDTTELLTRIRERWTDMSDADRDNRQLAMDDLKFLNIPGEQWDQIVRRERGNERPMYEFNKLRVTCKRVINDMRANRPQGKVRAVEDGDKPTANVIEGLCRNIWNVADGDTVIDSQAEYQVGGGMGAWRVTLDYADGEVFDQRIGLEGIRNPFCLYADPASQDPLYRDARDWILTDRIALDAFKERYPKAEPSSFEADEFDDDEDWRTEEWVRVVEYWWKEPRMMRLGLLSTGATVNMADVDTVALSARGITVLRERDCKTHVIKMCIAAGGDTLLEGPVEWAGKYFPFVMVHGETVVIDGRRYWFGLTRFGKDAQRAYNYSRTNAIESVALAPQAKWWATPAQALGNTELWSEAHKKNYPFLTYNADPQSPGPPQRMGGADVPAALIAEMQNSSEDIKAVTGIYDASLGARSNETSGRAISARQRQGEIATFNYMDNLAKGIRRTWEILIDLIPRIYDTERTVRILGADGVEDYARINTMAIGPQGTQQALNDLARGQYDVTVTVGPSFATRRQEAAESYTQMLASVPQLAGVAGDLIMKSIDLPYAEQIAERMQAVLPPQIQQMIGKGKNVPPEVAALMAQAEQAMQQVQQQGQLVTAAAAEADQKSAEIDKQIAQLEAKRAQFDAEVAKKLAEITRREAELVMQQAQAGVTAEGEKNATDRESLAAEVQKAVADIQSMAAQFMTQAAAVIADIQAKQAPQVVVANPPKRRIVSVERVNGRLVGEIQEMPDMVQ